MVAFRSAKVRLKVCGEQNGLHPPRGRNGRRRLERPRNVRAKPHRRNPARLEPPRRLNRVLVHQVFATRVRLRQNLGTLTVGKVICVGSNHDLRGRPPRITAPPRDLVEPCLSNGSQHRASQFKQIVRREHPAIPRRTRPNVWLSTSFRLALLRQKERTSVRSLVRGRPCEFD